MKWFKHMCDASDNDFLTQLEDEFGLEGYARWFKLCEAVGRGADPKKGKWSVSHPWSKWQQILRGKRKKLETFLEHSGVVSRTNQKLTGNILEIEIPKLREIKDEYSRKSGQVSGPKKQNKEEEEEEDKKKGVCAREPEYSQEFFEFMDAFGEEPNDGAWSAWCSVCTRTNFTALWRERLSLWMDSRQWAEGYAPSAENFLRKGYWQKRPQERPDGGEDSIDAWLRQQREADGE